MEIKEMTAQKLEDCGILFRDVFNAPPWNEAWTTRRAVKRLEQFRDTKQFLGYVMEDEGRVVGLICGQREEYYDGPRFYIQEFCVDNTCRGSGVGKALLEHLTGQLAREGIGDLCLMTRRGEGTEGYYRRRGFETDETLIWMDKRGDDHGV